MTETRGLDTDVGAPPTALAGASGELHRSITWRGAFWVASGVPALVLFSVGTIAATVGTPSWLIWAVSIAMGFLQSFVYAEIAGLFPGKSGGVSVHGAMAWVRYSKFVAPLSVWCNWVAWSPVLAIGSGLGAGYLLTGLLPADSKLNAWQGLTLANLDGLRSGLTVRVNAQFFVAAVLLLLVFAIQHHGILRAARIQMVVGVAVLVPLFIVGVVPLLTGDVVSASFTPFEPTGGWHLSGWTLVAGGLFIAAWSTYGFETAVCYTREFKEPGKDTFKAIFYSGLLCVALFILVPYSFQGALGVTALARPEIVAGTGVGAAMAGMVGGGTVVAKLLLVMLLLALLLSVMTSMAGSSRTLYQGSVDGWLPRYLGRVNRHGAPTRAMWTDVGFNLVLLTLSDSIFVLAASNVCYIIFNFLNLNAGWLHRVDSPHLTRPWRAPTVLIGVGTVLAFVNAFLMGWGANVWGPGTLVTGLVFAALIVPVFLFRHFMQDKGRFPERMYTDLGLPRGGTDSVLPRGGMDAVATRRAGFWPYVALAGGVTALTLGQLVSHWQ